MTKQIIDFGTYHREKRIGYLDIGASDPTGSSTLSTPVAPMDPIDPIVVKALSEVRMTDSVDGSRKGLFVQFSYPTNNNDSTVMIYDQAATGYRLTVEEAIHLNGAVVESTLGPVPFKVVVVPAENVEITFVPPNNTLVIFTCGGIGYRDVDHTIFKSFVPANVASQPDVA